MGGQHQRLALERRRARLDRVLRQRGRHRRGDPRLPSLEGLGDRHRRRRSANLACSGARTYTQPFSSGSDFKPGLDFYDDGAGHIGQAKALQQYAATHNVKMVVVLIGANDYGFADIVQQCVIDWLTSPSWWKNYCHDDASMTSKFTAGERRRHHHPRQERASSTCAPRCATPATPTARGSCLRRRTPRRCRAARRSAIPERLHAPDDRRLRRLERRRRLGQQHRRRQAQQHGAQRGDGQRDVEHRAVRRAERARRPPPVREHRRPARGAGARKLALRGRGRHARSGSRRSARRRRCSGPTSSRRTRTRPTGARRRCATACARPTTPAPRAAAPAAIPRPGSTPWASRT